MNWTFNSFASWRDRLKASAVHFAISLTIALLAAALVFGVWYPYPYREVSGGRELFLLVVSVDVILGPMVTLAIFNLAKGWPVLRRDLAVVGVLQLTALGYGLWVVGMARPVHMVFEGDRFTVVHAVEISSELLRNVPKGIDALPLSGPTVVSLRPFKSSQEKMEATLAALQGMPLATRLDLWQPLAPGIPDIQKAAKSAKELKDRFPAKALEIDHALSEAGLEAESVVYLPLVGRKSFWTVFLHPVTVQIVAAMPLDSF